MIVAVPYVLHREKQRTAAVMVVYDAGSFAAAESRVASYFGKAVKVGEAVELGPIDDSPGMPQNVEVAHWEEHA